MAAELDSLLIHPGLQLPYFIIAHAEMEADMRLTVSPAFSQKPVCFQYYANFLTAQLKI